MTEELAVLEGHPDHLANAIKRAALYAEDTDAHEAMFVEVDEEGIETPASAPDATQAAYCTMGAELFDDLRVIEPVKALFPVVDVLEWLAWFDEPSVTVTLVGAPGAEVVSEFVITGSDHEVRLDCLSNPAFLEDVELWLPQCFDGTQFLDPAGDPVPTRIATDITALERIVDAVDRCEDVGTYPLILDDGSLLFEVHGETATVSGDLNATVDGPDFAHRFGPGFARIVRALEGEVTLQTGPDHPLAVVRERPGVTLRYFVATSN
jgi:hypothetical protein